MKEEQAQIEKEREKERDISVMLMNHASGDYTLAVSVSSGPRKLLLLIVLALRSIVNSCEQLIAIDRHCRL